MNTPIIIPNMTQEGYSVESLSSYPLKPYLYDTNVTDSNFEDKGFVKNPNLDDRFIVNVFCIWNSKGVLVNVGHKWGEKNHYKLNINNIPCTIGSR